MRTSAEIFALMADDLEGFDRWRDEHGHDAWDHVYEEWDHDWASASRAWLDACARFDHEHEEAS